VAEFAGLRAGTLYPELAFLEREKVIEYDGGEYTLVGDGIDPMYSDAGNPSPRSLYERLAEPRPHPQDPLGPGPGMERDTFND
jgi:hypothetical protein